MTIFSLVKTNNSLPMPQLFGAILMLTLACSKAMAAGALAIDEAKGDQYGWAVGFPTYQEAEQNALRECGEGCHIVMRVSDSCAAYAADQEVNSTVIGWSQGYLSADEARNRALAECRNRSDTGSQCIVRVWGCDTETLEPRSSPGASGTVLVSSPAQPARVQASGLPAGITGEETCAGEEVTSMCWMELENQPGCYVWLSSSLLITQSVTWNGTCIDGLAGGTGTLTWGFSEGDFRLSNTGTGRIQRGKTHDQWVIEADVDGNRSLWKGSFEEGVAEGMWIATDEDEGYVTEAPHKNGVPHGRWVTRESDGSIFYEITYVNGELQE